MKIDIDYDGLGYRGAETADLLAAGLPIAAVLAGVQKTLGAGIDARAEALRLDAITPGAGQAMEYQQASVEAFDALATPATATADLYPMLAASIGTDVDPTTGKPATDVLGVARSVQASMKAWLVYGAAIRGARLAGKAAVMAAETIEAAEAAAKAVKWPAAE